MDAVIVIIGGMGPMAGAECFKYVTSNSNTNGTDQNNLDVMLVSFPSRIVNRVDFVLGRTDINPATSVLEFIKPRYFPEVYRVGIMSTDGTRHAKPFKQEFEAHNIEVVYLADDQQCVVTDCIYNVHWLSFLRHSHG